MPDLTTLALIEADTIMWYCVNSVPGYIRVYCDIVFGLIITGTDSAAGRWNVTPLSIIKDEDNFLLDLALNSMKIISEF